jgi:hypothetical protein
LNDVGRGSNIAFVNVLMTLTVYEMLWSIF